MKFYLTAAIPYVNAKPHLGHALEFVQGDVIARQHRLNGDEVLYISGADENSLKIVQAAEKEGITPKELADKYASLYPDFFKILNISIDRFQRSSSPEHFASSQELWQKCLAAGDIYKKKYKGLYCVGCEAFYVASELNEKGECFEHPGKKLEEVEEENYFFKLSKYQKQIEDLLASGEYKIIPQTRKNEALGFIKKGLQDFSVSRSKERAKGWGVPVPNDPDQIMYVWFDALNVYRSVALPASGGADTRWWPANLHIIGKGIFRFHAIYWPAILLSAKLPLPKELFVHGYITVDNQKMSKSVGNVIDPVELVKKYGSDAVRYYLLREIPSDGDGDFSEEKFIARYNGDLANGLGNFASRVLTLAQGLGEISFDFEKDIDSQIRKEILKTRDLFNAKMTTYKFHEALSAVMQLIAFGDKYVNDQKPWEKKKEPEAQKRILTQCLFLLEAVAAYLTVILPDTTRAIDLCLLRQDGKRLKVVKLEKPLFPRLK